MSINSVEAPYPIFTDIDGNPLENGYIYIGEPNLNPEAVPINTYWDSALTVPAAQPIRTIGGYPSRSGTAARIYAEGDYSITVRNKNETLVYTAPVATGILSSINSFTSMSEIIGYTTAPENTSVNVSGYTTANDGGGGIFNWDSSVDKATADAGTIIDPSVSLALQGTGVGNGCWIRQYDGPIRVSWFGEDVQLALNIGGEVSFTENKTYEITSGLTTNNGDGFLKITGNGATLNFNSSDYNGLDIQQINEVHLNGITLDFNGGAHFGLYLDTIDELYIGKDVTVRNITSTGDIVCCYLIGDVKAGKISGRALNVTGTAGYVGRGFMISDAVITKSDLVLDGVFVDGVAGEDDSDGIYVSSSTVVGHEGGIKIINSTINNCGKRFIKSDYPNLTISNNTGVNDAFGITHRMFSMISIYDINNSITNNNFRTEGIATNHVELGTTGDIEDIVIIGNKFIQDTTTVDTYATRLYGDANNVMIRDNLFTGINKPFGDLDTTPVLGSVSIIGNVYENNIDGLFHGFELKNTTIGNLTISGNTVTTEVLTRRLVQTVNLADTCRMIISDNNATYSYGVLSVPASFRPVYVMGNQLLGEEFKGGLKTIYSNTVPTSGEFLAGDQVRRTSYSVISDIGDMCTVSGTAGIDAVFVQIGFV